MLISHLISGGIWSLEFWNFSHPAWACEIVASDLGLGDGFPRALTNWSKLQ